ncbi:MAG: N-acetylmuramoyl-L-alanine amidase [Pseudomonadota bacterium]
MNFSVDHHLLLRQNERVPFAQTPNGRRALKPRYLIIHYTAGRSFETSVQWFRNSDAKASAHLVVGRKGEVMQMQAFDKTCWHAGVSRWKNLSGMNNYAIGIEVDNAGILQKNAAGKWHAWFGGSYKAEDVLLAKHRLGGDVQGWHVYTPEQVELVTGIATALHVRYQFEDILGHEDISWPRKTDPGPAFPLQNIKAKILGRR